MSFRRWISATFGICILPCAALAQVTGNIDAISFEYWPDGRATFSDVHLGAKPIWRIACPSICVGYNDAVTISLSDDKRLQMHRPVPEGARISLLHGQRTIDMPDLFTKPIPNDRVHDMSRGGHILIEKDWKIATSFKTDGLSQVLSYLRWRAAGAQGAWPQTEQVATTSPFYHLQIEQERQYAPHDQLVPNTKPQIQFAIRAQNGIPFVADPTPTSD